LVVVGGGGGLRAARDAAPGGGGPGPGFPLKVAPGGDPRRGSAPTLYRPEDEGRHTGADRGADAAAAPGALPDPRGHHPRAGAGGAFFWVGRRKETYLKMRLGVGFLL